MPRFLALAFALFAVSPAFAQQAPPPATPTLAPRVKFETSLGNFVVEVDTVRAPLTAENFLRYVRDGAYDGTVFHRVIANFVVQGGGYDERLAERPARGPIPNESGNGLSNRRGTLGLAREDSPHSGSSQFYINLVDNAALDPLPSRWGYAVFGRVVEGMEVVDKIGYLRTENVASFGADVPVERPVVRRAYVLEDALAAPQAAPATTPPADAKADPAQ
jgi:cyclophilin family peptidyl-prolyl cis-trans isomerase